MSEWTKERHEEALRKWEALRIAVSAITAEEGTDPAETLYDDIHDFVTGGQLEEDHESLIDDHRGRVNALSGAFVDAREVLPGAIAEIERQRAYIGASAMQEAKTASRLAHARDAAHGLYQATSRFLRSWDTNEPPLLIDRDIEALRRALDPDEAEACAREAARRDGLGEENMRLRREVGVHKGEAASLRVEVARLRAPLPEVDAEDMWTDYRTERGAMFTQEREAFFAGVEAGRRTRAPQSAPDASLEALAHARREADSVYKVNKGLGAEVAELRTKNAVLEAHLVAVDASRPGLSEEEARPDDRVSMDSELARAVRDTLGETTHYGVMERIEELLDVEKESASRGDVPAEVRAVSPTDRPTDAANRAAIMEAAVAPVDTCSKVLTRKDVEERLLACGMTPQTLSGIINNLQGELDTRDALGITGQETDIIRAYVQRRRDEANKVFPSEEPPTQPPQRERCKPIAGPWRQFQEGTGYSVFDDRGQCLGSVFPDVGCGKGWIWFAARPFDANANSTASDEESAKNAVREVLATWCDVTALAIPEAP